MEPNKINQSINQSHAKLNGNLINRKHSDIKVFRLKNKGKFKFLCSCRKTFRLYKLGSSYEVCKQTYLVVM